MQPGVYSGLPAEKYHASPGVSVSYLKLHAVAPAKARYGVRKETQAQKLGTLIHCAVTEPEEMARRYVATDLERAGTKAWDAAEKEAGGRILIKQPQWDDALRIQDAVYRHPVARELLLAAGPVEDSFWWNDPETGLLRRGRADKIASDMRVIVDLKSAEDAGPSGFGQAATKYLYDWQAASYIDGMSLAPGGFRPEAFIFLAVEKDEPFLVGVYEIEASHIDRARHQVATQLSSYSECEATDTWPGYSQTLEPLAITARADFR